MLYCGAPDEVFLRHFCFIDSVVEMRQNESITALYQLKGSEEFLRDHFENFPVMPGVLLLEALKQASERLLLAGAGSQSLRFRLVHAEDIKFGQFVRPGTELKIESRLVKTEGPRSFLEGRIDLSAPSGTNHRKAITAGLVLESVAS